MTEIERKALAWVESIRPEDAYRAPRDFIDKRVLWNALCRAIEQHESFRQEVSDKMYDLIAEYGVSRVDTLGFILPKPVDPFVALVGEAFWNDPNEPDAVDCAAAILAGLKARGIEVRKIEESE